MVIDNVVSVECQSHNPVERMLFDRISALDGAIARAEAEAQKAKAEAEILHLHLEAVNGALKEDVGALEAV